MSTEQPASEERVIKEHPNITLWLEDSQVKAAGNLVLTNERLVFLKQAALSEKETETLRKLSKEATTDKLLQFALTLHKKNFQLPLSSILSVKTGFHFTFPFLNLRLRLTYRSASKKEKTLTFVLKTPFMKVLFRSEPLTMEWVGAVKKAVKTRGKLTTSQGLYQKRI